MDEIRNSKTVCHVKVIVNPKIAESFTMKVDLYPAKMVNVTIVTPDRATLSSVVGEMKKMLGPAKLAFKVNFDWTNAPRDIRTDTYFKTDIIRLFGHAPAINSLVTPDQFRRVLETGELPRDVNKPAPYIPDEHLEAFADRIRTHIVDFGANPDFTNTTPKGRRKTHNYIKTICGVPHMTIAESQKIAELVLQ